MHNVEFKFTIDAVNFAFCILTFAFKCRVSPTSTPTSDVGENGKVEGANPSRGTNLQIQNSKCRIQNVLHSAF